MEAAETTTTTAIVRVTGRVQGVGYRAWCRAQARRRGLAGWVRNRTDGAVEACFCGAPEAVEQMVQACYDGPLAAAVFMVEASASDERFSGDFERRETV